MKILLDECLPLDFRHSFARHETHTVQWAGLKGTKNGKLVRAAEDAGYEILLTIDRGIPFQQSSAGRKLSIILIRSRASQLEDLLPFADAVLRAIETIEQGDVITIG